VSGVAVLILAGLMAGAGVVLAVRAARPATPDLGAALALLSKDPAATVSATPAPSTGRWTRVPRAVADALDRHVGVPEADLAVLSRTRAQLVARKLRLALAGLLVPAVVGLLLALAGLGGVAELPVVAGLGLGVVGWLLPSQEAKEQARGARAEFRSNLEFFLTLVAGERRARGSVEQALDEAASISDSRPFIAMRRCIRRAALAGRKPWADLRVLGAELAVPELKNLADIAEAAADGAAVYRTLLATAATLRHAEQADARAAANQISERMSRPLALLVFGLTLFVLTPFMLRMLGAA